MRRLGTPRDDNQITTKRLDSFRKTIKRGGCRVDMPTRKDIELARADWKTDPKFKDQIIAPHNHIVDPTSTPKTSDQDEEDSCPPDGATTLMKWPPTLPETDTSPISLQESLLSPPRSLQRVNTNPKRWRTTLALSCGVGRSLNPMMRCIELAITTYHPTGENCRVPGGG
jgi:hypothetical protein